MRQMFGRYYCTLMMTSIHITRPVIPPTVRFLVYFLPSVQLTIAYPFPFRLSYSFSVLPFTLLSESLLPFTQIWNGKVSLIIWYVFLLTNVYKNKSVTIKLHCGQRLALLWGQQEFGRNQAPRMPACVSSSNIEEWQLKIHLRNAFEMLTHFYLVQSTTLYVWYSSMERSRIVST